MEDESGGARIAQQARLESHHRIQQCREDKWAIEVRGKSLTVEEERYLEELYVPQAIQGHP